LQQRLLLPAPWNNTAADTAAAAAGAVDAADATAPAPEAEEAPKQQTNKRQLCRRRCKEST